ncbi:MAG: hypothetical protein LAP61_04990 [Acidobacteriia bacterium]|jgi:hypothetical protein|nr:hypothetical protein [Terriglobia bacterium]
MAEIAGKVQRLLSELNQRSAKELKLARWSHWLNICAMLLTLITTGAAVAYGIFPNHSSQVTAGLALVPGGISLLATSLKLETRCNWHYRRYYALSALIRTIEIELPETPTQDQIVAVSTSLGKLDVDLESVWEKDLSLDWKKFQKND